MTNATDLAAEIAAAYGEATTAVGDGPLLVTILRDGAATGPSYAPTIGADVPFENINSLIGQFSTAERTASLIPDDDIKLDIAAGQGVVPTAADRVTLNGVTRAIKAVTPFNPAGEDLFYTLHVKG
jgi:hypothetical protein